MAARKVLSPAAWMRAARSSSSCLIACASICRVGCSIFGSIGIRVLLPALVSPNYAADGDADGTRRESRPNITQVMCRRGDRDARAGDAAEHPSVLIRRQMLPQPRSHWRGLLVLLRRRRLRPLRDPASGLAVVWSERIWPRIWPTAAFASRLCLRPPVFASG